MAFEVCSGGAGSDAGVPTAASSRYGTRLVYLSMYASKVTVRVAKISYHQSDCLNTRIERENFFTRNLQKEERRLQGPKSVLAPS